MECNALYYKESIKMGKLTGKTALITGACRELAKELPELLRVMAQT